METTYELCDIRFGNARSYGSDRENEEIMRLSKAVERLEQEKHQRNQQHLKFEEELEQVEKTYRKDIDDLQQMVKNLVNGNRYLSTTVPSLPVNNDSPVSSSTEDATGTKRNILSTERRDQTFTKRCGNIPMSSRELTKFDRKTYSTKLFISKFPNFPWRKDDEFTLWEPTVPRKIPGFVHVVPDNNVPRFTLGELREVIKLFYHKREEHSERSCNGTRRRTRTVQTRNEKEIMRLDDDDDSDRLAPTSDYAADEDDLPVYGPMPKEPDEKLHPWKYERKDSGVRKFFRFFKDFGATASPRRGLSANASPRLPAQNENGRNGENDTDEDEGDAVSDDLYFDCCDTSPIQTQKPSIIRWSSELELEIQDDNSPPLTPHNGSTDIALLIMVFHGDFSPENPADSKTTDTNTFGSTIETCVQRHYPQLRNRLHIVNVSCGCEMARVIKNGHVKRITDEEIQSLVLEIMGNNIRTAFISCPVDPDKTLGIKLPFFVMVVKNMNKYFSFEVQIIDDKKIKRRFQASNYQSATRVKIHVNCRIRRVYFADRLYTEDELPAEFKLYLPIRGQISAQSPAFAMTSE
uniref:CASPASE_P20 domain-containing protein n=1 Tax=Caenorhabditis tropicalis TaxID=1561998 RepID=A0A1I7UHY6_9PELO